MKPDIYLFNPTCELAVANGSTNFMAPAQLRRFENELGTLPGILARPGDIVLADRIPPQQFIDQLEAAGFALPNYRTTESSLSDEQFLSEQKGFLFPWGWSPATHKQISPLKSGCCTKFLRSPIAEWREIHRELYSRKSALTILENIIAAQSSNEFLSLNDLPQICNSHDQITALQQKWDKVVVKAPWSSSGRGLQILRPQEYNQTNKQVIAGFLKQQEYVVAGPWHEKVMDLSFQFYSFGDGIIEYRGMTSFSTDHMGRYLGNNIQELPAQIAPELHVFLKENLTKTEQHLTKALTASSYSTDYYGWLGVDVLIWKSSDGKFKIHPCLEINCRFTMGAIALALRNHLADQSTGEFRMMHSGEGEFASFCEAMKISEPLIINNGRIVKGFLPLTPLSPGSTFGAYVRIINDKNH
jgi:hypothetical protein